MDKRLIVEKIAACGCAKVRVPAGMSCPGCGKVPAAVIYKCEEEWTSDLVLGLEQVLNGGICHACQEAAEDAALKARVDSFD